MTRSKWAGVVNRTSILTPAVMIARIERAEVKKPHQKAATAIAKQLVGVTRRCWLPEDRRSTACPPG
jgi:hypothetical protein